MIDPNTPSQSAAIWASQVGRTAAAMPANQPYPTPASPGLRLAAIVDYFRRRDERMDHARKKLNAEELLRD
jgi:hypothetical protein